MWIITKCISFQSWYNLWTFVRRFYRIVPQFVWLLNVLPIFLYFFQPSFWPFNLTTKTVDHEHMRCERGYLWCLFVFWEMENWKFTKFVSISNRHICKKLCNSHLFRYWGRVLSEKIIAPSCCQIIQPTWCWDIWHKIKFMLVIFFMMCYTFFCSLGKFWPVSQFSTCYRKKT